MENIKTCELCLEQIIKTEDFENCDGNQNLKALKYLAITVSKDAKVCSNCVDISHLMYNFKTSCLTNNDHLKTLIHPGINDKLILEEVIVKNTKSEFKNEEKVCRFCLNFFEVNSLVEVNLEQDVVLKDILGRCFPEIDTNIVQNPLICYICSELLEKLYNFISRCKDTEVLRNLDTKTDVLINENSSTETIANNEIEKIFVKEENCEDVENPELQIKSEDPDIVEVIKDPLNVSDSLLKEHEMQMDPLSFSSDSFRCKVCFYKADSRMSLLIHQQTHGETRKVTSELYQSNLVRHKENDKNPSEICNKEKVELYRCNTCSFTANNKREIVKHKKKGHKDRKQGLGNLVEGKDLKPKPCGTVKEKKYVCDICLYQTTRKYTFQKHCLIHKEPSEVNVFKCDYCPYATKWKNRLTTHTIRHKDPSELPILKCNDCPYETNSRSNLVRHVLLHKGPSGVNMYKCKVCSFQTTRKYSLQQHCLTHMEPSEVNVFKCDYCPYVTKRKDSLTTHTIRHKNPSDLPKFKCTDCPYGTNWRSNLARHSLLHKGPSEVNMCNF